MDNVVCVYDGRMYILCGASRDDVRVDDSEHHQFGVLGREIGWRTRSQRTGLFRIVCGSIWVCGLSRVGLGVLL